MPQSLAKPCPVPGCPHLRPCPVHEKNGGQRSPDNRESSAKRGYDRHWRKLRKMYLRANPLCVECGGAAIIADHITPKRAGGPDAWDNLQSMCQSCHNKKIAQEKRAGLI